MSDDCEHDFVEPRTHEATGDEVVFCCQCDKILHRRGMATPLPGHWHDHAPTGRRGVVTGAAVIDGALPVTTDGDPERWIQICGNCGHWLGAVWAGYFAALDAEPPYDRADSIPGFIDMLMESLCPECGAAIFRWTMLVASLKRARGAGGQNTDFQRIVRNLADERWWHGDESDHQIADGMMRGVKQWNARCPCCGYAAAYGGREFDFHHWDYNDDIGCMLCRDCHSHIHRGMTASEQGELSDSWKRDAIRRLYDRSTANGLNFDRGTKFAARFNIPSNEVTRGALSNLFDSQQQSVPITELMDGE